MVPQGKVLLRPDPLGQISRSHGGRRRELAAQSCPVTFTFSAKRVRDGCGYTNSTHTNKKYWKKQTNQKTLAKERAEDGALETAQDVRVLFGKMTFISVSKYTCIFFHFHFVCICVLWESENIRWQSTLSSTVKGCNKIGSGCPYLGSEPFPRPLMHSFV